MSKKIKLEYTPDLEFLMIGIVSSERDYRLTWEINETMLMDFSRIDDHAVRHRKSGEEQQFSCFIYDDEDSCISYKLLSNRSDKGYLLEDLVNIDFLLIVKGDYILERVQKLKEEIFKLNGVQTCLVFEPEKIKNCERIL